MDYTSVIEQLVAEGRDDDAIKYMSSRQAEGLMWEDMKGLAKVFFCCSTFQEWAELSNRIENQTDIPILSDPERIIRLVVNFDGGSKNNGSVTQVGYGSYRVIWWESQGWKPISRLQFGAVTSNVAEYMTAIAALEDTKVNLEKGGFQPRKARVEMRGDSALVINQVQRLWKISSTMAPWADCLSNAAQDFGEVMWVKVPREENVRILGH